MRRDVILNQVRTILDDLTVTGMVQMFEEAVDIFRTPNASERVKGQWPDIEIISKYKERLNSYSEEQINILKILGLEQLSDFRVWKDNIQEPDREFILTFRSSIRAAVSFLPKFVSLFERDVDKIRNNEKYSENDVAIQKIVLSDETGAYSSIDRIILFLQSVDQIYSVICEANGIQPQKIAVISMDSGSEKSFDFLGVAQFVHELREVLQSLYNMISFHKQNVTIKNLQIAGETLSVVEKISQLEQSQAISTEDAARMRHGLFSGLEKFAATGAYTPEMNVTAPSPSLVMRAQPHLLSGPADSIVREANSGRPDDQNTPENSSEAAEIIDEDGITESEILAALKLIRNRRTSGKTENASKPRLSRPRKPR